MTSAPCQNSFLQGQPLMRAAARRLAERAVAARARAPRRHSSGINAPRPARSSGGAALRHGRSRSGLEDQGLSGCHGEAFRLSFDPYAHGPIVIDGSAAGVPEEWEFIG